MPQFCTSIVGQIVGVLGFVIGVFSNLDWVERQKITCWFKAKRLVTLLLYSVLSSFLWARHSSASRHTGSTKVGGTAERLKKIVTVSSHNCGESRWVLSGIVLKRNETQSPNHIHQNRDLLPKKNNPTKVDSSVIRSKKSKRVRLLRSKNCLIRLQHDDKKDSQGQSWKVGVECLVREQGCFRTAYPSWLVFQTKLWRT